jgi:hypothetical protein
MTVLDIFCPKDDMSVCPSDDMSAAFSAHRAAGLAGRPGGAWNNMYDPTAILG